MGDKLSSHLYGGTKQKLIHNIYRSIYSKGKRVGHVDVSLRLPHVIINSMQALCALSHLQITFRKALFIQHVLFKDHLDDRTTVPKVVQSSFLRFQQ